MADTIRRLLVVLSGDAKSYKKEFSDAQKTTDTLGRSLGTIQGQVRDAFQGAAGHAGRFGSVLSSLGPAGIAAAAGIGAMAIAAKKAADEIKALAERGTQVLGVERSFQALAQAPEKLLESTRAAAKGVVSDFDIMQSANKGLLLGLPITADEMAKLTSTAITLGEAMNVGPGQALQDLITGLGRGSAAILDNLGINVKAEDAYQRYAASIGKTTSALTEQEKKIAVYRAALEAADQATGKIGASQESAGKAITAVSVAWQNLFDEVARVVAQDPALIDGLTEVANAVSFIGQTIRDNKDEINLLLDALFPSRVGGRFREQAKSVIGEVIGARGAEEGLPTPKQRSPLRGGPTGSIGDIFGSITAEPLPGAEAQLKALTEGLRQDFEKLKNDRVKAAEEYQRTLEKLAEEERRGAIEANKRWAEEEKAVEKVNEAARKRISEAAVSIFGTSKEAATEAAFQFGILQTAIDRAGSSIEQMSSGELANFEESLVQLEKASRADAQANDLIATTLGKVRARQREVNDEWEKGHARVTKLSKATEKWLAILKGLSKVSAVVGALSDAFDEMGISADRGIGKTVKALDDLARGAEAGAAAVAQFASGNIVGGIVSGFGAVGSIVSGFKKLFGSDPVKKAQKAAGRALGHQISREMAQGFLEEAKRTGKTIEQVAKEWQRQVKAEQDAANLEALRTGVDIARQGAETLLSIMEKLSPAAAAAAGALVQAVRDALVANGLGFLATGDLAESEAFGAVEQAVAGAGQVFQGFRQAGAVSTDLLAQGGALAEALRTQAVEAAKEAGLSDAEAQKAGLAVIAPLLRDQLEASIQSGQELSAQTQQLIDEARANGIEIVADPMIALLAESKEQTAILRKIAGGGPTDIVRRAFGERGNVPGFAGGSGGFRDFGSGTPVILHGVEGVFRPDQISFPSVSSAPTAALSAGFGGRSSQVSGGPGFGGVTLAPSQSFTINGTNLSAQDIAAAVGREARRGNRDLMDELRRAVGRG